MARILRGDIWWVDLDPVKGSEQAGRRPVLIISHDILNEKSGTAIALAITSKKARPGFPLTLPLRTVKMPKLSWVKMNQVRTLSAKRFSKRIGRLPEKDLAKVIEGLMELVS